MRLVLLLLLLLLLLLFLFVCRSCVSFAALPHRLR
jgi:hypothetical protein